jgi:predicted amino acid racemase
VTGLRLEVDLVAVTHNARTLVDRLAPLGIGVTGVTKASLGWAVLAEAMLAGGVTGLGDSRIENLSRMRTSSGEVGAARMTLIRAPMPSQVGRVASVADVSCNTELSVVAQLSVVAAASGRPHGVIIMVELGDLREGVMPDDRLDLARATVALPGIELTGLGTNLACQSGVAPGDENMAELTRLVELVEHDLGVELTTVSGGNSATLPWVFDGGTVGRVNDLRLGEAILLGCEPLHRRPVPGLRTDAFRLVAEVIESVPKPSLPWGELGQTAFGDQAPRVDRGWVHEALLAAGRQDVDPDGLRAPEGLAVVGASSDHLVVETDVALGVGDEVRFGLDYSALMRAMTSPFVARALVGTLDAAGVHATSTSRMR